MKVIIITTSIGLIALDEKYNIISSKLFQKDDIESIETINKRKLSEFEIEFIEEIAKDYENIIIETHSSINNYSNLECIDKISIEKSNEYGRYVRENLSNIISKITNDNITNVFENIQYKYQEIAKNKIRESVKTNDVMIIETVNSLEELEESTGKLIERLREWNMPYLPELDKLHNHELYTKIIAVDTTRENIKNSPLLENTNITLSDSYDIELDENDLLIIKSFATSLNSLYETKKELESYIQDKVKTVAPNLYDVAGPNLAAKLIAHTNGLENLAKLPSSTVQIIGAEKAIFRHLKTGEKPPKHGLIYQHPYIRGSNWWIRGKLARAIAGKISIAARKDAFTGEYDSSLKEQLSERVEKIKKDYPFPERKTKKVENNKKSKKRKDKRKKGKRNKRKLKKGEYTY